MDGMLSWGMGVIKGVQAMSSPGLDAAMKILTLGGDVLFYLVLLPFLFWCVDEKKSMRLGMLLFFSTFLNGWLKGLFAVPRPFVRDPSVGIVTESGFSTPSGHAQMSATFWGGAALLWRRRLLTVLAFALPLVIGFTRVYLGVHYPTDVFFGWAIGAALLGLWALFGKMIEERLEALNVRVGVILVAALSWLMCLLYREDVSSAAAFLGLGLGWLLNEKKIGVAAASGGAGKKALRYLLGIAVLAGLYVGLKALLPGETSPNAALYRFLRYGLMAFWVSAAAPWLFLKMGLADLREGWEPEKEAGSDD